MLKLENFDYSIDPSFLSSSSENSSAESSIHSERRVQYPVTGQEQQYGQVLSYDYGYPTYHQPYESCYWQPDTSAQQDIYHSSSHSHMTRHPDPHNQSTSQPYENLETEGKCKKKRVPYTAYKLRVLEERFEQSDTIAIDERNSLAEKLDLTRQQVKVWFQNQRAKVRNSSKKQGQKEAEKNPSKSDSQTSDVRQDNFYQQDHQKYEYSYSSRNTIELYLK